MVVNPRFGDENDDEMRRRALEELMAGGVPDRHTMGVPGGNRVVDDPDAPPMPPGPIAPGAPPPPRARSRSPQPVDPLPAPPSNRRGGIPPVGGGQTAVPNQNPTDPLFDPRLYIEEIARRGGVVNPHSTLSGAARGASAGGQYGGVYGAAAGAAIGAIAGRATRKAATQPTDLAVEDARLVLANVIQNELGHEPTRKEIDDILRGQGWKPGDRWVGEQNLLTVIGAIHSNAKAANDATPAAGATPPSAPPTGAPPPAAATGDRPPPVGVGNYKGLPGWETDRLNNPQDNDPKTVFGRFVEDWIASGREWNGDGARAFVASDPRWRIDNSNPADPKIWVDQAELDKWKPGRTVPQDVVRDAGGANGPQFINADGSGGGGGGDAGGGGVGGGGARPYNVGEGVPTDDDFFQELLKRARGIVGPTNRDALMDLLNG